MKQLNIFPAVQDLEIQEWELRSSPQSHQEYNNGMLATFTQEKISDLPTKHCDMLGYMGGGIQI